MKKSNSPYVAATKSVNRSAGVKPAVTSPVSQKFYRYMEERIAGACLLLGGKIRHEDVMAVINYNPKNEKEPLGKTKSRNRLSAESVF